MVELLFAGPQLGPTDAPARDVDFRVRLRHESGLPEYRIYGFWDGDGQGGVSGNTFKIRFWPTEAGRWELAEVYSNADELNGQRQGEMIATELPDHPGFWMVDEASPGQRWYRRSDGSHPFIFGNTHYSFLSGYGPEGKPVGNDIAGDIRGNARYLKKLRFSLFGDHYPNPTEKPFLDGEGRPTDWGDHSHRPNPKWFHERVDLAVRTACECDLIADLILAGPDQEAARATLRAENNNGDPTPFLKYVAARYGSYPNVWICLCNEYDIPKAKFVTHREVIYTEAEIVRFGQVIRGYLPYPTPVSVHNTPRRGWAVAFDELPPWNDHQITQKKVKQIAPAADNIQQTWANAEGTGPRNKPTINDELSYQGAGDGHSEGDTIESHLGAFLGGGYGSSGEKPGDKLGQYFWGEFDAAEHSAVVHLGWLREAIDAHVTFWKMAPDLSVFENLDDGYRGMAWCGDEYVLGTNAAREGVVANLPAGTWTVTRYDVVAMEATTLSAQASGRFAFDTPDSRAVLFHFRKNRDS